MLSPHLTTDLETTGLAAVWQARTNLLLPPARSIRNPEFVSRVPYSEYSPFGITAIYL